MLYDLIVFYFRRTSDLAFALIAHATKYMDARQLRDAGDYLRVVADDREEKLVQIIPPQGGSGTAPPSWKQ